MNIGVENIKMNLKNKNLLIVTNGFPSKDGHPTHTFVKSQIDKMKGDFNKIIIISPTPYLPRFLLKLKTLGDYYKNCISTKNYSYDNVEIYYPRFPTFPLKFFRERNANIAYPFVKKALSKYNLQFDLIHAHFTWPSGYVGLKLKEEFNKKLFLTIHENSGWFNQEIKSSNNHISPVWKNVDVLIRVNKKDLPTLKKFNPNSICINNGFNSQVFHNISKNKCREQLKIDKNKQVLLHVGFYKQWHKNQLAIIRAVNEVVKGGNKNIITYLIGGGPDEKLFQEEIDKLKLNKHVKLLGAKPHSEIPKWMNASDLFILPSFQEGNPVVMFESLACATPIIASDVGGIKEIITSSKLGYILKDQTDFKEIANYIQKSLLKKWDDKFIIKHASKYTWKESANQLVKLYKKELDSIPKN